MAITETKFDLGDRISLTVANPDGGVDEHEGVLKEVDPVNGVITLELLGAGQNPSSEVKIPGDNILSLESKQAGMPYIKFFLDNADTPGDAGFPMPEIMVVRSNQDSFTSSEWQLLDEPVSVEQTSMDESGIQTTPYSRPVSTLNEQAGELELLPDAIRVQIKNK